MSSSVNLTYEQERIFGELPHVNPFFDINNAIKFVAPLNKNYPPSSEKARKVVVIRRAYKCLLGRQDKSYMKSFHRLAEEFLREYRESLPDERIKELISQFREQQGREEGESVYLRGLRVREVILKQDKLVQEYFKNFFLLSVQYLYAIGNNGEDEG